MIGICFDPKLYTRWFVNEQDNTDWCIRPLYNHSNEYWRLVCKSDTCPKSEILVGDVIINESYCVISAIRELLNSTRLYPNAYHLFFSDLFNELTLFNYGDFAGKNCSLWNALRTYIFKCTIFLKSRLFPNCFTCILAEACFVRRLQWILGWNMCKIQGKKRT